MKMSIHIYWWLVTVIIIMFLGILIDIKLLDYKTSKAISLCTWEAGLVFLGIIIGKYYTK